MKQKNEQLQYNRTAYDWNIEEGGTHFTKKNKENFKEEKLFKWPQKMGRCLPNRQGIGICWERRYSRTGERTAMGRHGSMPGAEQAREGMEVGLGLMKLDYQGVLLYA